MKEKKMRSSKNGNGVIHPSEHIALAAEDAVFDKHDQTQRVCEIVDERLDAIQKKIETRFHHRRKGDKNEKSTSS